MPRDPSKHIVEFRALLQLNSFQLVLVLADGGTLTCVEAFQSQDQTQLFADGYIEAFFGSADLTNEAINSFLNDPTTAIELPVDMNPENSAILKKGVLAGLRLAA